MKSLNPRAVRFRVGNDPRIKAERVLSKNLVYLCRNQTLSAKEISEKLGVPIPYIEDEMEIQLKGENGNYGLLRKAGKDKYISNILILDIPEWEAGTKAYTKHLKEFCDGLRAVLSTDTEKIVTFVLFYGRLFQKQSGNWSAQFATC